MPPGSIIAGGAVRDFMIHAEPKDIDVFCATISFDGPPEGFYSIDGSDNWAEEYQAMSEIDAVCRGTIEGYQVDVVFMNLEPFNAQTLVEIFDVTTSQCWFDGTCHAYADAVAGLSEGLVKVLRYERISRTIERFDRFNARHDGRFQLVFDPERASDFPELDFTPLTTGTPDDHHAGHLSET